MKRITIRVEELDADPTKCYGAETMIMWNEFLRFHHPDQELLSVVQMTSERIDEWKGAHEPNKP